MPPFDEDMNDEFLARLEKLMQEALEELRQRPRSLPPGGLLPTCCGNCVNCPYAPRIT